MLLAKQIATLKKYDKKLFTIGQTLSNWVITYSSLELA